MMKHDKRHKIGSPVNKCPFRSPMAVSESLADLIKDKTVFEIGCAQGDNLIFMSRFCKKVFGFDNKQDRCLIAQSRGLDAIYGDYRIDDFPKADVYYFWPNKCEDNEFIINKIFAQGNPCKIIVAADDGFAPEVPNIKKCVDKFGGEIRKVRFYEGDGHRENGTIYLAIITYQVFS